MEKYEKFNNVLTDQGAGTVNTNITSNSGAGDGTALVQQNVHPLNPLSPGSNMNKVRLRAVESEAAHFLKVINTRLLKRLALIQAVTTLIVFVCQVVLYASASTRYYKAVDYSGIGIWGPLLFFSIACGLCLLILKSPSGCAIGTALAFQILTAIVVAALIILASISLASHGYYSWNSDTSSYDPEIAGRVFCSFMLISGAILMVTAIFISIHFCKATCCSHQQTNECIVFDVEAVK